MSRPPGSRNAKPTKAAIKNYYAMLTAAADQGDLNAAGKLIELDCMNEINRTSGWRGDRLDPRDQIITKIRENDPESKQLPVIR